MAKNNRKKVVAQAISTAFALGLVIMQVESAEAATLTVNNLDDSGVGSLRDAINIASSNDVVEFLLGSNPSTITLTSGALAIAKNLTINGPGANLLTISGNNQFPVFDITAADVTLSGLAIAGDINGYNSSNITFINSTVSSDDVKINNSTGNVTFINSTINGNNSVEINANSVEINASGLTVINDSNVTVPTNNGTAGQINFGGNISVIGGSITVDNSGQINGGGNNSGAGGSITVDNSGQINGGGNNSGAGGSITITGGNLTLTTVPEPSAIAGVILAGGLAWLAKRKQTPLCKAKV
ncbi:PEP-CTERM sorting domain-containing protein [Nostoc sp. UCD121]|uniref:PEP-CTERM sorting domain-containing protein n=1 Tax=unclassified Nostoc TaxID=2593658 RepID=UPI0016254F59|nr:MULTISPECIES: PEP-CTERM sorting domain-containing protein [unclassified Nostoc]MBC1218553.1 PEP-CTERM sorting domain-containing protein [Nostoc sp. UCD120]MBC1274767.1 PEP-CTERM sorting domain-containing protein [Nostoc sp. UCD121]MBC1297178.1 PEP-CTERM sorting domain-containing protein [Nostoc sp. UCD122]